MNYEFENLEDQFKTEHEVEEGSKFVQEKLWIKLEKVGTKIRFAKDAKALFRYMKDRYVPWYRKSIVVAALVYFISPIDAVPDLAPLIGYLDDLGVVAAVIKFLGSELIPFYD